jgi:hypothetical protein
VRCVEWRQKAWSKDGLQRCVAVDESALLMLESGEAKNDDTTTCERQTMEFSLEQN